MRMRRMQEKLNKLQSKLQSMGMDGDREDEDSDDSSSSDDEEASDNVNPLTSVRTTDHRQRSTAWEVPLGDNRAHSSNIIGNQEDNEDDENQEQPMEVQHLEVNSERGRPTFGDLTNNVNARMGTPPLGMMKAVGQRRRNTQAFFNQENINRFISAAIGTTKALVEQ